VQYYTHSLFFPRNTNIHVCNDDDDDDDDEANTEAGLSPARNLYFSRAALARSFFHSAVLKIDLHARKRD